MKKHLKKVLALLLIATSFNFLPMIGKTYGFVCVKDTPFCIEKKIYDENPDLYSKSSLNQVFQKAKDKIYEKLGLNYTDKINHLIAVVGKNIRSEELGFTTCKTDGHSDILITKNSLWDNCTLPHEMTHALLCHSLGERRFNKKLNLGINEGLATQSSPLDTYGLSSMDQLFSNTYPSNDLKKANDFYAKHQLLVATWIKFYGKNVVKKWLEKVKNGEDSVKAFRELGGDEVIRCLRAAFAIELAKKQQTQQL